MDKIYLKNIEIFANHGVFQEEKTLGQKFILSLELSLDFHKAAKDGDLSASVHYGELCHNVEKVFKEEVCDLLETLVYKVGAYVLDTYEVVKEVKISLKKPWAPISRHLDYAAVETTIARHKAYITLGSNIGNKEQYIRSAIEKINELEGTKVTKESKLLVTKPWGKEDQEDFLNAVIREAGITNAVAIHGRSEDLAQSPDLREKFDFAVSRAVAAMNTLSEYCVPFVKTGGYFIAYKTGNNEEEIQSSKKAITTLGGSIDEIIKSKVESLDFDREYICIKKTEKTKKKYPRKAGEPKNNPL